MCITKNLNKINKTTGKDYKRQQNSDTRDRVKKLRVRNDIKILKYIKHTSVTCGAFIES